jgi:nitroimidazol reductase NimA-like FMN-containing flavoprotein (pyridoxamine 5'-phosphate oxidase superfamily)
MERDTAGLEVLSREESLDLLASVPVGRVVYTDRALPAILPVNYVLDEDAVVFRTGAGSKLAAATREAVVAFEADSFDAATKTGWSVMVVGRSRLVDDDREIERLAQLNLGTWVPTQPEHFVKIDLTQVSGRRLRPNGYLDHGEQRTEVD